MMRFFTNFQLFLAFTCFSNNNFGQLTISVAPNTLNENWQVGSEIGKIELTGFDSITTSIDPNLVGTSKWEFATNGGVWFAAAIDYEGNVIVGSYWRLYSLNGETGVMCTGFAGDRILLFSSFYL